MENFCSYFKDCSNEIRAYHFDTKEFRTYDKTLDIKASHFYITKSKDAYMKTITDDDLVNYANKLYDEAIVLKKCLDFDYLTPRIKKNGFTVYHNHESNVIRFFMFFCSGRTHIYNDIEADEAKWIEKCRNGGLQYFRKGEYKNCFGYDYKKYYQNIMKDDKFIVPYDKGEEKMIKKIPNVLICGYYRCMISSSNKFFNTMFQFSDDHVYTHTTIKFCRDFQEKLQTKIQLIVDDKPNAYYYYAKKQCKVFNKTCGDYIENIEKFQQEHPTNSLTKMLSSKLHGSLSKGNKITKTKDEIVRENLDVGHSDSSEYKIVKVFEKEDGIRKYTLMKKSKPYLFGIARIKPFITSFGRSKTMKMIVNEGIENCLYCHTDGVILSKKIDNLEQYDTLRIDEDKTGDLRIISTNRPVERL